MKKNYKTHLMSPVEEIWKRPNNKSTSTSIYVPLFSPLSFCCDMSVCPFGSLSALCYWPGVDHHCRDLYHLSWTPSNQPATQRLLQLPKSIIRITLVFICWGHQTYWAFIFIKLLICTDEADTQVTFCLTLCLLPFDLTSKNQDSVSTPDFLTSFDIMRGGNHFLKGTY